MCAWRRRRSRIRRTFTEGAIGTPKSGKARRIEIADEVVDLLGAWWGDIGKPADDTLVLPGDTKTGYLNPQVVLRRELYPAMERAGIPREDANGELRVFHSLRHYVREDRARERHAARGPLSSISGIAVW